MTLGLNAAIKEWALVKRLVAYLIEHLTENVFEGAFVEAETDDVPAVNFYKTTPINSILQLPFIGKS